MLLMCLLLSRLFKPSKGKSSKKYPSYTTYSLHEIGRSLGSKSMSSDGMQFAVKIYLLPSETLYIIVPVIRPSYTHARNAERLESGYGLEVISS